MGLGGLFGGSKKTTTTTTEVKNLPAWIKGPYLDLLNRTQSLSQQPYQSYEGERIVDLSPDELDAINRTRGYVNQDLDTIRRRGIYGFNQQDLQGFMNPYMENVIDVAKRNRIEDYDLQKRDLASKAAQASAFGGSRFGLQEAELLRRLNTDLTDIDVQGRSDAYNQAVGAMERGSQYGTQAAAQGLSALEAIGAKQRGIDQGRADVAYEDFLMSQEDPYKKLNALQGVVAPLAQTMVGSTSTQTQKQSGGSGILGAAIGIGSMLMGNPLGAMALGGLGSSLGLSAGTMQMLSGAFGSNAANMLQGAGLFTPLSSGEGINWTSYRPTRLADGGEVSSKDEDWVGKVNRKTMNLPFDAEGMQIPATDERLQTPLEILLRSGVEPTEENLRQLFPEDTVQWLLDYQDAQEYADKKKKLVPEFGNSFPLSKDKLTPEDLVVDPTLPEVAYASGGGVNSPSNDSSALARVLAQIEEERKARLAKDLQGAYSAEENYQQYVLRNRLGSVGKTLKEYATGATPFEETDTPLQRWGKMLDRVPRAIANTPLDTGDLVAEGVDYLNTPMNQLNSTLETEDTQLPKPQKPQTLAQSMFEGITGGTSENLSSDVPMPPVGDNREELRQVTKNAPQAATSEEQRLMSLIRGEQQAAQPSQPKQGVQTPQVTQGGINRPLWAFGAALLSGENDFFKSLGEAASAYTEQEVKDENAAFDREAKQQTLEMQQKQLEEAQRSHDMQNLIEYLKLKAATDKGSVQGEKLASLVGYAATMKKASADLGDMEGAQKWDELGLQLTQALTGQRGFDISSGTSQTNNSPGSNWSRLR